MLILHGTGGQGKNFLQPIFAGVLFGPGQLLDANKYFLILPDNIGHGKSSKPSDGLHAHFPRYEYADMVSLQHELVEQGLGVNHLRLILGTSMGCIALLALGENYADFMDALMPLACLPVQIAGRNRIWRKMVIDGTATVNTDSRQQSIRPLERLLRMDAYAPKEAQLRRQREAPRI